MCCWLLMVCPCCAGVHCPDMHSSSVYFWSFLGCFSCNISQTPPPIPKVLVLASPQYNFECGRLYRLTFDKKLRFARDKSQSKCQVLWGGIINVGHNVWFLVAANISHTELDFSTRAELLFQRCPWKLQYSSSWVHLSTGVVLCWQGWLVRVD